MRILAASLKQAFKIASVRWDETGRRQKVRVCRCGGRGLHFTVGHAE